MAAAVKAAILARRKVTRAFKAFLRVHRNPSPPQVHTQHIHFQQGLLRFSNKVRVHRFSSPPFVFPLHPFPFAHLCFPLFFHVLLSSCLVISSFLSFARTWVPALVCTCATLLQPRFQVAQVFIMRRVFIGCGSLSSHHPHLCPVWSPFHVFILLSCCLRSYTLP